MFYHNVEKELCIFVIPEGVDGFKKCCTHNIVDKKVYNVMSIWARPSITHKGATILLPCVQMVSMYLLLFLFHVMELPAYPICRRRFYFGAHLGYGIDHFPIMQWICHIWRNSILLEILGNCPTHYCCLALPDIRETLEFFILWVLCKKGQMDPE